MRAIAIDETSVRKRWNYVTVIIDAHTRRLLHVAPGRSGEALREFRVGALGARRTPGADRHIAMDMLHCFKRGARENFLWGKVIFDRYHVMVMAGEAVEKVRRDLQNPRGRSQRQPLGLARQ